MISCLTHTKRRIHVECYFRHSRFPSGSRNVAFRHDGHLHGANIIKFRLGDLKRLHQADGKIRHIGIQW
jgi:hypothetical protein